MKRHQAGIRIILVSLSLSLGLLFWGCGEKIAIPEPSGAYSINQYTLLDSVDVGAPAVQLTQGWGFLFVLTPDAITKYDAGLNLDTQVTGLGAPSALCADIDEGLIFVWENNPKRVTWYDSASMEWRGSNDLPTVFYGVAMTTNPAGADQAGATTFLYISDPQSQVIHRFAFNPSEGLTPYGILANSEGSGTRSVHSAAGLSTDSEGFMLVCDADTSRNWVTRFSGSPDPDDELMRGFAAIFDSITCAPAAAPTDYVIGDAPVCDESDWVGGPSKENGEFFGQTDVAVDGIGRIFVVDKGNNRIQIFDPKGNYDIQFTCLDSLALPTSLGVFDETSTDASVNFGAFILLTLENRNQVYKYISEEHKATYYVDNPPDRR